MRSLVRLLLRQLDVCRVSTVDCGHVPFVMAFTSSWCEVVEPFDLCDAQLDAIGGSVLLDTSDPPCTRDRSDIVALDEQPSQCDLCRCRPHLGGDGFDLIDDA